MKKYFLSILSALMLASSASAQFVITKTDDTKTNVDGKLTVPDFITFLRHHIAQIENQ